MNRTIAISLLFFGLSLAPVHAQITISNTVPFQSITNATNAGTVPVLLGNAQVLPMTLSLEHGLITNLTDLTNWVQISVGSATNWATITNFCPTVVTAGGADAQTIGRQSLSIYVRVLISTTNVGAGVSAGANVVNGVNGTH